MKIIQAIRRGLLINAIIYNMAEMRKNKESCGLCGEHN